jgi:hypothetical protein
MIDLSVNLDTRPLIVVVKTNEMDSRYNFERGTWMVDKYARKKLNTKFRALYRNRVFTSFDNSMISVSSYFVCPKDLIVGH